LDLEGGKFLQADGRSCRWIRKVEVFPAG